MATSPQHHPSKNEGCLPCINTAGDVGHVGDQHQEGISNIFPAVRDTMSPQMVEMKQTESLLASEMFKLSQEERNRALDDVHCVGEELKETPEMVEKSLDAFDQAVRMSQNPIYEIAMKQNRAYVEDSAFRLTFLRANFHDVDKSVLQMMNFLQHKAKLFGQDTVAREIVWSDLTEEDIGMISSSVYHVQEGKDRMGRLLMHYFKQKRIGYSAFTWNRVTHYIWWNIIIANPDVQTKGVAAIYHSAVSMPDIGFLHETIPLFNSLPVRFSATHYCLQTTTGSNLASNDDPMFRLILAALPQYIRVRSRMHYGSYMEIQYQLRSHGIPIDNFPLDYDGNIRSDILPLFEKHLQQSNQPAHFHQSAEVARLGLPADMDVDHDHWNQESSGIDQVADETWEANEKNDDEEPSEDGGNSDENEGIVQPTDLDVLFGKGYTIQMHPGNIRFRRFLEQHRGRFESVPRAQKSLVVAGLVQTLHNSGVRFLQKGEDGAWIETYIVEAERKAAQHLRELRKRAKKKIAQNEIER